jgi:hypothetical protein
MNQRIRELARQAGFETNEAICSFGNYKIDNEYFFAEDFIEDELAKFAELIVKECADKVDSSLRDWLHDNSGGTMGDKLKEHFGVEE